MTTAAWAMSPPLRASTLPEPPGDDFRLCARSRDRYGGGHGGGPGRNRRPDAGCFMIMKAEVAPTCDAGTQVFHHAQIGGIDEDLQSRYSAYTRLSVDTAVHHAVAGPGPTGVQMSEPRPIKPTVVVIGGGTPARHGQVPRRCGRCRPRGAEGCLRPNVAALRALVDPSWLPRIYLPYDGLLANGRLVHDRAAKVDIGHVALASGGRDRRGLHRARDRIARPVPG